MNSAVGGACNKGASTVTLWQGRTYCTLNPLFGRMMQVLCPLMLSSHNPMFVHVCTHQVFRKQNCRFKYTYLVCLKSELW